MVKFSHLASILISIPFLAFLTDLLMTYRAYMMSPTWWYWIETNKPFVDMVYHFGYGFATVPFIISEIILLIVAIVIPLRLSEHKSWSKADKQFCRLLVCGVSIILACLSLQGPILWIPLHP